MSELGTRVEALGARVSALEREIALAQRRRQLALTAYILPALLIRLGLGAAWQGVRAWGGAHWTAPFAGLCFATVAIWLALARRAADRNEAIRGWRLYQVVRRLSGVLIVICIGGLVVAISWSVPG